MQIGLDRLPELPLWKRIRSARLGVLAHPASVNRQLIHIADVLHQAGIRPRILFGPEHGYGGEAQDMASVKHQVDPRTGAQIVSLYGDSFDDLVPKREHLAELDLLLIDLADVGARYYTFVWTALLALRAAHREGVHVVVLDRPNPISGAPESVEGALQEPGFLSFVGLERVPVRHALTIGELLALFAQQEAIPLGDTEVGLTVVGVHGWDRNSLATSWDRPFVFPSPNMPTADTALVYPGGCLVEGTNLSEGRGTTRPFEIIGAPWIQGRTLATRLMSTGLGGFVARPITFQPMFQKHAGRICGGIEVHVIDAKAFRPFVTYLTIIGLCHHEAPEHFRFRTERYEYVDTIAAFDLLTGSSKARLAIEAFEDPLTVAMEIGRVDNEWEMMCQAAGLRIRKG